MRERVSFRRRIVGANEKGVDCVLEQRDGSLLVVRGW